MKKVASSSSPPPNGNVLYEIYAELSELPFHFRERVCHECNWSIPTFYRAIRKQPTYNKAGMIIPELSNANRDKIISTLNEIIVSLERFYDRYSGS
jgi:hypothetical protein